MNDHVKMVIAMAREYVQEPTDRPRHALVEAFVDAAFAPKFAQAIVQLADACVVGLPCERHGGAVHGREAEELCAGLEKILKETYTRDVRLDDLRRSLIDLLDAVDARDSFSFLEAPESAIEEK